MDNSRIRVGVVRGGPSHEYDVSLESGATVLRRIPSHKYDAKDIFIDKDGVWHMRGVSTTPEKVLRSVDVVFNALHGQYGEDGKIQQLLEDFSVPYTGSGVVGSALSMNKVFAKKRALMAGIKTPDFAVVRRGKGESNLSEQVNSVLENLPFPVVVKPASFGSSVGIAIARDEDELAIALYRALAYSPSVIVEEFIKGKEATCGVVDHFRGKEVYPLLPVEIRPPAHKDFFDYEAKYTGISEEVCPGNFSPKEMSELQRLAEEVHKSFGLRHYSRSDFIVTKDWGIYFLETNTLPGLTSESLMPKALWAVGAGLPDFFDHIITLALNRK